MKTRPLDDELREARRASALRDIIIPPCPDLLVQLQAATAHGDPDPGELDRIASAEVAMSAALIRLANSPLHGLHAPVSTVGQALTVLGLNMFGDVLRDVLDPRTRT